MTSCYSIVSNPKSHEVIRSKQLLVMDEVDGMSSGDRGGMAELIQIIKKTKIPIVCICNDRQSPKVRSLANHCEDIRFRRPEARQITPRIIEIAKREGLNLATNVVDALVSSTQSDIRQILNIISTWKRNKSSMSYDEATGKARAGGIAKKDMEAGIFDVAGDLLGGRHRESTLSEKLNMYFVDASMVPLMIQVEFIFNAIIKMLCINWYLFI